MSVARPHRRSLVNPPMTLTAQELQDETFHLRMAFGLVYFVKAPCLDSAASFQSNRIDKLEAGGFLLGLVGRVAQGFSTRIMWICLYR